MSGFSFDPAQLRQLAAILSETGLTEIEVAQGENRIRVAKAPAPTTHVIGASAAPGAAPHAAAAPVSTAAPADDFSTHPGLVKSPMVGVAYLSPEPSAAAFVTQGQTVAAGQTLLLIEAMKTFNQIKAPKAGTVARILIASGAPVEYGEPLLVIE